MGNTRIGGLPEAGSGSRCEIATVHELRAATDNTHVQSIVVTTGVTNVLTIRLAPQQWLRGCDPDTTLHIVSGLDAIQLTAHNRAETLTIRADPDQRTLFSDTNLDACGCLDLRGLRFSGLRFSGRVCLFAENRLYSGHVDALALDILAADVRGVEARPKGYGAEVIPGGSARAVDIAGRVIGRGSGVPPLELHGAIDPPTVAGGFAPAGGGFEAI